MALVNKSKLTKIALKLSKKNKEIQNIGVYGIDEEVQKALDKKIQKAALAKLKAINAHW